MEDKEPLRGLRVLKGAWVLRILSTSTAQRRNHGPKIASREMSASFGIAVTSAYIAGIRTSCLHPQCPQPAQPCSG